MGEYVCDICSKTVAKSDITFHPAAMIHEAVRGGLNLWRSDSFEMYDSAAAATSSLDFDALYEAWRQLVLADHRDWGLCDGCSHAITSELAHARC